MEYTELKQLWDNNEFSEVHISLNKKIVDELTSKRLKSSLSEIKSSAIFEIITTTLFYIFLMNFTINHYQDIPSLVSGIILIAISLFSIIMEIQKLYLYYSIDHGFSIMKAQRQIEKLKFLEKLDINLLYLFMPLFFVPFVWVFSKGILGIDLYQMGFGMKEIISCFLGSIFVAIFIIFFLRKTQFKDLNESLEFLRELK